MTDIVEIAHPVPFSFIPRRATIARQAMVTARTSMRIPRIDEHEVGDGPVVATRQYDACFHEIEGRLFLRVDTLEAGASGADLLAVMARPHVPGRPMTKRCTLLEYAIARTPLSCQVPVHGADGRQSFQEDFDYRGEAIETLGTARIRSDGTDAGRARLLTWVEGNVRLAGDGLYVDTGGPLLRPSKLTGGTDYQITAFPRLLSLSHPMGEGPCTYAEAMARRAHSVEHAHKVGSITRLTPDHYDITTWGGETAIDRTGVDTDVMYANLASGLVLDYVSPAFRAGERGVAADFNDLNLRDLAMLGSIGAIDEAMAPEVLGRLLKGANYGLGMAHVIRKNGEGLRAVSSHISDWVLPRLAAKPANLVEEDAESLRDLAP